MKTLSLLFLALLQMALPGVRAAPTALDHYVAKPDEVDTTDVYVIPEVLPYVGRHCTGE